MCAGSLDAHALILVDVQRAFVVGDAAVPDGARVMRAIDELLGNARAAGALIVHLQNDGCPGAPDEPGQPGWELVVLPRPSEVVVRKSSDDGFDGTGLDQLLRQAGVSRLVIAGIQSEMCVAATARSALQGGFSVILPDDAHATYAITADTAKGRPGVSAAQVSRVAAWSLGDEVVSPQTSAQVTFGTADSDRSN